MTEERTEFEPWAWGAFALAASTAGLFLFLGSRPGGAGPVLAYRFGVLVLGWASAVGMLLALLWSLRRRPVLQRRRAWPLTALGASLWFCSLPIAYPSSHEGQFSPTRFRLPFEGPARVRLGGDHKTQNHLIFDPARRFGSAFVGLVEEGDSEAKPLSVCAPADGTILQCLPGRAGLVVVLATSEVEFCLLEGLEEGSCIMPAGASVTAGEPLGLAQGLLTVHLQDDPEPGRGEGIPMRYWHYRANGRAAEAGVPIPPQEVVHDEESAASSHGGR